MRKLAELEARIARLEKRATNKVYPIYTTFQGHDERTIKIIPLPRVLEAMVQDRRIDEDQIIEYMTLRKKYTVDFVADMFIMFCESQTGKSFPISFKDDKEVVVDMSEWPEDDGFDRWFKDWAETYLVNIID